MACLNDSQKAGGLGSESQVKGEVREDRSQDSDDSKRGDVTQPLQPAGIAFHIDRLAAQVGLDLLKAMAEIGQRQRLAAKVGQGRIAAGDAQHGPATGLHLDGADGGGDDGWVAGRRVGRARGQLQPAGCLGSQAKGHEHVSGEALRVGEGETVPAVALGERCDFGDAARDGECA